MAIWKKILWVNIGLGLIIALIWSGTWSNSGFSIKNWMASLALISLVAGPVDLVAAGLIFLFKKKDWAKGMLFSALFFFAAWIGAVIVAFFG